LEAVRTIGAEHTIKIIGIEFTIPLAVEFLNTMQLFSDAVQTNNLSQAESVLMRSVNGGSISSTSDSISTSARMLNVSHFETIIWFPLKVQGV